MRGKHAALIAALLLLTTACSRSASAPASDQSGSATGVPVLPPAKLAVAAEAIVATAELASLPRSPVPGIAARNTFDPGADAEREKAKANLRSLLEASTNAPAKGLEDALLAYYRRPDVAELAPPLADPPHTYRMVEVVGTKEDPSPTRPNVISVNSFYADPSPWRISLLQWQAGGKVYTAPLPTVVYLAVRGVTYQGRPAFLFFVSPQPESPQAVMAYRDVGGRLEPITLADQAPIDGAAWVRLAPNQLQFPQRPAVAKSGFSWACFTQSCVTIGWNDASGLSFSPAGFGPAEARQRLTGTDGNSGDYGWTAWVEQISDRLAAPGAMDRSAPELAQLTAGNVATATSGNAVARMVYVTGTQWLASRGEQLSAMWLLVRAPGTPDLSVRLDGGGYLGHRVLRDGDQTYILLLTEAQPRPDSSRNVLQLFALQGGKLQQVQLPDSVQLTRKVFVSMDGQLILTCPDSAGNAAACGAIRIEGGKLATLAKGALAGQPSTEAQQSQEQATAKFKAGAFVEAAQGFRQAVELAPAWLEAWNDLSFACQKAGDWSAALMAADTAANLSQQSGAAKYNLGVSYLALGNAVQAMNVLEQAVLLQGNSPDTWLALAKAREQTRPLVTAAEAYKKVLVLDPGNKEAAEGLKRVEAK